MRLVCPVVSPVPAYTQAQRGTAVNPDEWKNENLGMQQLYPCLCTLDPKLLGVSFVSFYLCSKRIEHIVMYKNIEG